MEHFLWLLFWKKLLLGSALAVFYLKAIENMGFCAWSDFLFFSLSTCLSMTLSFELSWKDQFFPSVKNSEKAVYKNH